VEDIFLAALQKHTVAERTAYLEEACGGDRALRQQVEALLQEHDQRESRKDQDASFARKRRVDDVCLGFERARKAGQRPRIEDYLATAPGTDRAVLFRELLLLELAYRRRDGETVTVEEYRQRFPDQATAVDAVFAETGSAWQASAPPVEGLGTRIGPYKFLQQLGEGGMGTVYLAEQEQPVRRRVALKIIKAGLDSVQIIARFEQERQALALMDHPHIAKVLDAGTTPSGRPFFVMELIKGLPITKYCDQEQLTLRHRLQLFLPVCQAVQHAHQKGIIHRDLKPTNVLVGLYDSRPVPKVIDFGVAKATTQKLIEKTMFTEVGQVLGTLEYMAPEQAELNNLDIDTRADIYALGAILYELLTGSPPFGRQQLQGAAFVEMLRLIREEEPPRPSARLSTVEELPTIAAKRGMEPHKLSGLVHGDLDWITMKALEKDRAHRYESANALAMDLQHYLADEPVQAGPPSAMYRLRKFARRNRTALGTALLVALALVVGTVVSVWQAAEARKHESAALAAQANLENANAELTRKRDEVEIALARSLVRPLARQPASLTEAEMEALRDLAGNPSKELWKRFVEQALRDPRTTRQLKTRAELALHAAVGLDFDKRQQVERWLCERLQSSTLTVGERADLALIAVSLGGLTTTAQTQVARTLIEALDKVANPSDLCELASGLSTLAGRMEREEGARVCSRAATIVSNTLAKTPRFETLANGLADLASYMEPKDAARACSQVVANLAAAGSARDPMPVLKSMIVLAPYLETDQAAMATAAMMKNMNAEVALMLATMATRMDRKEATRVCAQAADTLVRHMREMPTEMPDSMREGRWNAWVKGVKALAPYLISPEASKVAAGVSEEMIKAKNDRQVFRLLASALAALAPCLDPRDADKAAASLAQELTKATVYNSDLSTLLTGLDAIAPQMDPKEAVRLYSRAAYPQIRFHSQLIKGFSAAALRMTNQDASNALLRGMTTAIHPFELLGFAEALSKVAVRMEPQEAARVRSQATAILTAAMGKWDEFSSRWKNRYEFFFSGSQGDIAKAISAIAPSQQAQNTGEVGSQAIASVLQFLTKLLEDYDAFEESGNIATLIATQTEGLAALAALPGPKDVAPAVATQPPPPS
jgi:serine/threonine protein kinase